MKKLIVCLVAFVMCAGVYAQKGTFSIDGTLSYSSVKDGASAFSLTPSVNYFVSDNMSVGLGIGYSSLKLDGEDNLSSLAVAFGGTYYAELADNFFFTPSAGIGIITQKDVDTGFAITAQLIGFEYRPTEKIGLTFGCGGISYLSQEDSSLFDFTVNATPTLGFKYFF